MPQIPVTTRLDQDRPLVKIDYQVIPQPAAGQNLQFTVPVGYRFKLISTYLSMVTDANVGDRLLFVQVAGPNGAFFRFQPPYIIVAGETRYLTLATNVPQIAHSAINMSSVIPFPTDLTLEEGTTITIGLVGIQVGDQFSAAVGQLLSQFVAE
jgi:hypothetical protein